MAKRKRAQVIVDEFLTKIVAGEMAEGTLLPTESTLIETFGVSRTAVREAVQVLAAKGFAVIRQGSGTTVAPRTRWNVLDPDYLRLSGCEHALLRSLVETREAFEPRIAALAADRVTAVRLAQLRELVEGPSAATPGRHQIDLDIAFHQALAEASANPVLISLHSSIAHLSRAQREFMGGDAASVERSVFWHKHIVAAIADRDPGAAHDAMRMHLRQVQLDLGALTGDLQAS